MQNAELKIITTIYEKAFSINYSGDCCCIGCNSTQPKGLAQAEAKHQLHRGK
jgi:hypothetical protein